MLCEIGGTVGDIEGLPFLEAIRQLGNELGRERALFVHLTLVPYIPSAGELKTKPTQHSVKELRGIGIQPDILLCRCDRDDPGRRAAQDRAVLQRAREAVIPALDVDIDLRGAGRLSRGGLRQRGAAAFRPARRAEPDLGALARDRRAHPRARGRGDDRHRRQVHRPARRLQVAGRGADPWRHRQQCPRQSATGSTPRSSSSDDAVAWLEGVHGILVPGGFGERGTEGKIAAVRFARERKVPFFGICFGMQMAVIEAAPQPGRPEGRRLDRVRPAPSTRSSGLHDRMGARQRAASGATPAAISAARCGWAPILPCSSRGSQVARDLRRGPRSASATATATRSTSTTGAAGGGGPALLRHVAGRRAAGDRRDPGPSLVHRRAVPPRAEVASPSSRTRCSPPSSSAAVEQSRLV